MPSTTAQHQAEPSILTSCIYFWTPSSLASGRRQASTYHEGIVNTWLQSYGFTPDADGIMRRDDISVSFTYHESCAHCYKCLSIHANGRKHNLTWLRNRL